MRGTETLSELFSHTLPRFNFFTSLFTSCYSQLSECLEQAKRKLDKTKENKTK